MGLDFDLHAFVEELTKTIDDFDGQIVEFELDPKSTAFVSKLRRIISKAFSVERNSKLKLKSNSSNSNSGENRKRNPGKEQEEAQGESTCRRKSYQLKTPPVNKKNKKKKGKFPKFPQNISEQRMQELEKADQHLRSVEMETCEGFYTLHKCLLCEKSFSRKDAARGHVFRIHLKIKFYCRACTYFFFNQESLQRHKLKCSKVGRQKIHVISSCGEKRLKVHVYSQSKNLKSSGSESSPDSNQTDKSLDPEKNPNDNSNVNVKVRNPFDGFCLKKAMSAKIEMSRLNSDKVEKTAANIKSSKQKEDKKENARENKKSEVMEKGKKRAKTVPSKNQTAKHEKSRIFDVEGAQLICGIEQNFLV